MPGFWGGGGGGVKGKMSGLGVDRAISMSNFFLVHAKDWVSSQKKEAFSPLPYLIMLSLSPLISLPKLNRAISERIKIRWHDLACVETISVSNPGFQLWQKEGCREHLPLVWRLRAVILFQFGKVPYISTQSLFAGTCIYTRKRPWTCNCTKNMKNNRPSLQGMNRAWHYINARNPQISLKNKTLTQRLLFI